MLAEAFSHRQLHLLAEVHPGRLEAADPAHPGLPYPCLTDSVIFQGKYYFLQEPLPGVVHLIWRKVTGFHLPTGASIIAVALGCFLLMGLLLFSIRSHYFRDTPVWLTWIVWISFAVSGSQLYIVSRPVVYHETIVWGAFFTLCATAFFFRALFEGRPGALTMFLCGLFCGLAILSRVTYATYAASFGLGFALTSLIERRTWKSVIARLTIFAAPFLCCVGLLLMYNHLRFGDFLDFGRSRVTIPSVEAYEYCCLGGRFFSLSHVIPNLETYLFGLPDVSFRYIIPWVRFSGSEVSTANLYLARENVASLFIMMPILIAAAPLAIWPRFRAGISASCSGAILTCCFASLASFAVFALLAIAQARYLYEITPLSFPVVYYNLAVLWRNVKDSGLLRTFTVMALLLLIVHGIMGLYLGVNGMVQWR